MKNFFDDIDNEMNMGTQHVVPIITEISVTSDNTDLQGDGIAGLPILPTRNMVLFPGMTMPIGVGREKSMRLIQDAAKRKRPIGVICQLDSNVDEPGQKDLYQVGTVADVIKILEFQDGSTNVILQGRSTFHLDEVTTNDPYLQGNVTFSTTDCQQPTTRSLPCSWSTSRRSP